MYMLGLKFCKNCNRVDLIGFIQIKGLVGGVTEITVTQAYNDLTNSPFYVGQKLRLNATNGAGNDINTLIQIKAIAQDPTTGKLKITLLADVGVNTRNYTEVVFSSLTKAEEATANIEYLYAELVMNEVVSGGSKMSQINYRTYTTEEDQGNDLTNYQKMFQLEPEAVNFFMMFPRGDNSFISNNYALKEVRCRVDGVDLWDRPMALQNGFDNNQGKVMLYKDRLNMTMMNAGLRVKNLLLKDLFTRGLKTEDQESSSTYPDNNPNINIICSPVNLSQNYKNLQINIEAPTTQVTQGGVNVNRSGVGPLILYKQVVRQLKL